MTNILLNNKAELIGIPVDELVFSHESYGEAFYNFKVSVPRLSEIADTIMVTASERLFTGIELSKDKRIGISGQFRSYNNYSGNGSRLLLTLFAKNIYIPKVEDEFENSVVLNGFLCKPPVYRTTPFGREITDILIAVNRTHNKSDYIPCIAWGRNAKYAQTLEVGDNIIVTGRMQSREYQKKNDDGEFITKTAYEVSVSKIENP